jgi:hypothetical protein
MQSQMISMQSTLDRILNAVQGPQPVRHPQNEYQQHSPQYAHQPMPVPPPNHGVYVGASGPPRASVDIFNPEPESTPRSATAKSFPPLPGFAPPVSAFPSYGFFGACTQLKHFCACE